MNLKKPASRRKGGYDELGLKLLKNITYSLGVIDLRYSQESKTIVACHG